MVFLCICQDLSSEPIVIPAFSDMLFAVVTDTSGSTKSTRMSATRRAVRVLSQIKQLAGMQI